MIELGSQLHTVSALQDCKHWKGTYNLSKWTSDAYTYSSTLKSYKYFKDSTRLLWLIEKLSSRKLPPRSDWPKRWPQRQVPRPTRLALQGQRCCIYLNCSRSCSSCRWHCCILGWCDRNSPQSRTKLSLSLREPKFSFHCRSAMSVAHFIHKSLS